MSLGVRIQMARMLHPPPDMAEWLGGRRSRAGGTADAAAALLRDEVGGGGRMLGQATCMWPNCL